jgi:hypothetical protein
MANLPMPEWITKVWMRRQFERGTSGAADRLEQSRPHAEKLLPIGSKRIQVALRNAASQVAVDVLNVFRRGAVDVAWKIKIKIVLGIGDFGPFNQTRVAR